MPGSQYTMAEMFKAAGYTTGHIGKWHVGYSPETMPNAQGFDYSFGFMGGCIDNYSHFFSGEAQMHMICGVMAKRFLSQATTSRI